MSEGKGYLDVMVLEGETVLKTERIVFNNVIDALLELESIALEHGGSEEEE